jgi:uncharacterized protein (TIGR03083 family)
MTTVMIDIAEEYRRVRLRITGLTRDLEPEELRCPVPACPGWSVHDVVAHVSGAAADVVNGNMENAPRSEWTAVHVALGAGRSIAELLQGWDLVAETLEAMLAADPERFTFFISDIICHEIDIRSALGRDPQPPSETLRWAAANFVRVMARKVTAAGLPALGISCGDMEWVAGDGEQGARLEAPSVFELTRAMTGRRSVEQVRAWSWEGDADSYLPYLSVFEPRPQPLEE